MRRNGCDQRQVRICARKVNNETNILCGTINREMYREKRKSVTVFKNLVKSHDRGPKEVLWRDFDKKRSSIVYVKLI